MYRWGESEDRRAEVPVDKDNHALAALRYLIATIDRHNFSKRGRKPTPPAGPTKTPQELAEEKYWKRYWEMAESDDLRIWRPMG